MGHDEKNCKQYQSLQEKEVDTYLMKNYEQMQDEQARAQFPQPRGVVILEIEDEEEEDLGDGKTDFYL